MSAGRKLKEVDSIMARASKQKRPDKVYVVASKSGGGVRKAVAWPRPRARRRARAVAVDARMKKDKRAAKSRQKNRRSTDAASAYVFDPRIDGVTATKPPPVAPSLCSAKKLDGDVCSHPAPAAKPRCLDHWSGAWPRYPRTRGRRRRYCRASRKGRRIPACQTGSLTRLDEGHRRQLLALVGAPRFIELAARRGQLRPPRNLVEVGQGVVRLDIIQSVVRRRRVRLVGRRAGGREL